MLMNLVINLFLNQAKIHLICRTLLIIWSQLVVNKKLYFVQVIIKNKKRKINKMLLNYRRSCQVKVINNQNWKMLNNIFDRLKNKPQRYQVLKILLIWRLVNHKIKIFNKYLIKLPNLDGFGVIKIINFYILNSLKLLIYFFY